MIRWVDTNLIRGPRPGGSDGPSLQQLRNSGVQTIISLQSGWWEWSHGELYAEDAEADALGITVHHIPISAFGRAPTMQQVKRVFKWIDAGKRSGVVYVHCKHGVDRTGFVIAAWRVLKSSWSPQIAILEMMNIGFHRWNYFWWPRALRRLCFMWGNE